MRNVQLIIRRVVRAEVWPTDQNRSKASVAWQFN